MIDKRWASTQYTWGLRVQLYIRYTDDLRLYLWPIKPGWEWNGHELRFNEDEVDDKGAMERTVEQICKTLISTVDFLTFTMESLMDGYLVLTSRRKCNSLDKSATYFIGNLWPIT